jgi:hypothetical protein
MAFRSPPRKVTYFEPVPPRLARNTHHRVDVRGRPPLQLHDARRLRPARPRARAGCNAVYKLAALTIGARLAVADA